MTFFDMIACTSDLRKLKFWLFSRMFFQWIILFCFITGVLSIVKSWFSLLPTFELKKKVYRDVTKKWYNILCSLCLRPCIKDYSPVLKSKNFINVNYIIQLLSLEEISWLIPTWEDIGWKLLKPIKWNSHLPHLKGLVLEEMAASGSFIIGGRWFSLLEHIPEQNPAVYLV